METQTKIAGVFWENWRGRKAWYFRDYTGAPCVERFHSEEDAQEAFNEFLKLNYPCTACGEAANGDSQLCSTCNDMYEHEITKD